MSISREPLAVLPALDKNDPLLTAIPLPRELRDLVGKPSDDGPPHPGLRLDKYLVPAVSQEQQKQRLLDFARNSDGDRALYEDARQRRQSMLENVRAYDWTRTNAGPLTLHLARASVLENAGICLHPIHGFVYLPGTGLKGLARAYAETVWLPSQQDETKATAKAEIEHVFGHLSKGRGMHAEEGASGSIVFHDAWPEQWPPLIVDIVNNHHADYYQGKDAPGDWESPTMVYFLAVPAGQRFHFALSCRRDDEDRALLDRAREWLDGGLTHLGCGAKTAAGYGRFAVEEDRLPLPRSPRIAEFESQLTLVTPAFLAGADQSSAQDCDLRGATLRGLLRWWWRTLHAGWIETEALRALEADLWGNTRSGSHVRISITPTKPGLPTPYDYRDKSNPRNKYDFDPTFRRAHGLEPRPRSNKTSQGLFYASYGMDDQSKAGRRFHLEPGASWRIRIAARQGNFPSAALVADQARAALWLLCRFGAVGSKSRKGFGSLHQEPHDLDLQQCMTIAADFRRAALGETGSFRSEWVGSPALGCRLVPLEIATRWSDPWYALDQIGAAYQAFTQHYKHDPAKLALGLPRKIHGPRKEPLSGQRDHQPPQTLRGPRGDRHASPVHIHVGRGEDERLVVRILALPAVELPNLTESTRFLQQFLDDIGRDLGNRAQIAPTLPKSPSAGTSPRAAVRAAPKANDRVTVRLLPEKTKKGGWLACHVPSGLNGPVQDPKNVLHDKQPGDEVTLTVASVDLSGQKIQFKAQ